MTTDSDMPAAISQTTANDIALSGHWTARRISGVVGQLDGLKTPAATHIQVNGSHMDALDAAGAWALHKLLLRLKHEGSEVTWQGLRPKNATKSRIMCVICYQ